MPTFRRLILIVLPVHTRRGLLAVTLALQAFILGVGLLVVFNDIRQRVAVRLTDRILEQNIRTAESLARTMDEMGFGPAYCGSVGRERAQKLIEELQLPAGGFVCLLDKDNRIICHPKLRQEPSLCGIDLTQMRVVTDEHSDDQAGEGSAGRNEVRVGDASRTGTLAGTTQFLDSGTHFLASHYIESMQARVVVQQPVSGLLAFGEAVASGSMLRAAGLGALALGMTGLVSFVLIRRHNRVLEQINKGLEHQVQVRVGESMAARHSLIIGLAKLAESRDTDTGEHLERIALYSELLARQLAKVRPEIDEGYINDLMLASTLHDIGKVGIPDNVLLKPGRLTPEERVVIERHPGIGAHTLAAVHGRLGDDRLVELSLLIARSHHEKYDGTGYPDRLAGENIPLAARIVALADVYDALTSPRVYKPAMPHQQAATIIREGRGTHFDPQMVDAFNLAEAEFDRIRAQCQPAHPVQAPEPAAASVRLAA